MSWKRPFRLSLMGKVIAALAVVGLLPLVIYLLQAENMADELVEQSQKTHLATVGSVAERVAARLELWRADAEAAVLAPAVYGDPASPEAGAELTRILRSHEEVLAAGFYLLAGAEPRVVQQAYREGFDRALLDAALEPAEAETWRATSRPEGFWVRLRQPVPGREDVALFLLADFRDLDSVLRPQDEGLDSVDLALVEGSGTMLMGYVPSLETFPESLRQAAASSALGKGAGEFEAADGRLRVAGYADVPGTDWYILSQEPEAEAKQARGAMRVFALQLLAGVLLLTAAFAGWAYRSIVRPIRDLVRAQRELAGLASRPERGSEIEQLQDSFRQLERHLHDREALSKVFLGRFQVVETLGVGAMGTVFRGFDPKLKRQVALKTFKLGETIGAEDRRQLSERLVEEAVALARIQHPNIVTVFDIVDDGSAAFIAMELVEGVSLESYLHQVQRLAEQQAIALGVLVLRAIGAAHENGIVHHDVKPANILLGRDRAVKVTDFGIAEVLSNANKNSGVVCGTPGYLPPETLQGKGYDERSDLFAVGVVLYQCLVGQRPFDGRNPKEIMVETLVGSPLPIRRLQPEVSEALEEVVLALLSARPERRPESAGRAEAMLRELAEEDLRWNPKPFRKRERDENEKGFAEVRTSLVPTRQFSRV